MMNFHLRGRDANRAAWLDPPPKAQLTGPIKTNPGTSRGSMEGGVGAAKAELGWGSGVWKWRGALT